MIRTILFRVSEGEYVLVLMAGPGQISWKALRRYLGQSRITMASEEEVRDVTGYPIGAVSPFGIPQPIRILVDESVFDPDEVSIGSGERYTTIILTRDDLRRALDHVEIVSLGEGNLEDE